MAKGFRGGMGMGGNMNRVVAQAQKAQRQIELAQAEIREMRFTGTAGGELVKVVVGGDHQLYEVQIDQTNQERINAITGGLNLPF